MTRNRFAFVLATALFGLLLAGCGQETVEAGNEDPAVVEAVGDGDLHRITVSAKAAERLDIQTASMGEATVDGERRLVMPYGALLWDAAGTTWVYTSPEERVFIRAQVMLDHIDGDLAVLSDGPNPGTLVATVGVSELWGTETGVGGGH